MPQQATGRLRTAACLYSRRRKDVTAFVYRRADGICDWTATDLVVGEVKGDIIFVYLNGELIKQTEKAA